ncbi:MAG: T9SS type A sorting domain-containing protein [Flavobacteriaceae bacterium]|jgi:hypothetical protein|nr:T9SS type A sorting domain-containing protein [Flavobacteriaceae bacterium]
MKTKLLITITILLGVSKMNSQTTHNLDWFAGIGQNVDLTIDVGDTVIWTWTSPNHTVENVPGNSVEVFDSGFLGPIGSTYSYTFTVVGDNDYFCGVHGAFSMSGTITVQNNLGVDDFKIDSNFNLYPNPTNSILSISFKNEIPNGTLEVYDMLGKKALSQALDSNKLTSIDISNLNSGLYLIKVSYEGKSETKQFLKN